MSRPVTRQPARKDDMELVDLSEEDYAHFYYTPPRDLSDIFNGLDFIRVVENMHYDVKSACGSGNTYFIKNSEGEKLMYAVEDSNCCCRWICGPHRMFHITLYNNDDEPVLHLDRSCCRCDWCCCFDCCCCQHKIIVRDSRGNVMGFVKEKFHIFHCKLEILGPDEDEVYHRIKGPCCACRCCTEMNFDIKNKNGDRDVGFIFKRYLGYRQEVNFDHDNFELFLPGGLTVQQKALLLAASFLVNFMYFEVS